MSAGDSDFRSQARIALGSVILTVVVLSWLSPSDGDRDQWSAPESVAPTPAPPKVTTTSSLGRMNPLHGKTNTSVSYSKNTEPRPSGVKKSQTPSQGAAPDPDLVIIDKIGGSGAKDKRGNLLGWFNSSRTPEDYLVGIGKVSGEGEDRVAYVHSKSNNPRPWGTIVHVLDVEKYSGKVVKVSAWIKATQVDAGTFWMSASGANFEQIGYEKRKFHQNFDWKKMEFQMNVPTQTRKLQLGITLDGRKQILMKDVRVVPVNAKKN